MKYDYAMIKKTIFFLIFAPKIISFHFFLNIWILAPKIFLFDFSYIWILAPKIILFDFPYIWIFALKIFFFKNCQFWILAPKYFSIEFPIYEFVWQFLVFYYRLTFFTRWVLLAHFVFLMKNLMWSMMQTHFLKP